MALGLQSKSQPGSLTPEKAFTPEARKLGKVGWHGRAWEAGCAGCGLRGDSLVPGLGVGGVSER